MATVLGWIVEGSGFKSWFGHLSKVGIVLISLVDTARYLC